MYLGAHVLLPEGFDDASRGALPAGDLPRPLPRRLSAASARRRRIPTSSPTTPSASQLDGYNRIQQEHAYEFYKDWTGPDFPRFLVVEIQHPTPYYDDSYAVNSANLGPYGDAIMHELVPEIERQFRGLGAGLGALHLRRLDRRLGGAGGAGLLSATSSTAPRSPAPTRSTSAPTPWSTSTRTRTPTTQEGPFKRTPRPGHRN